MSDYTMTELESWNEKIEKIAKKEGLSYYIQEFEICDYEDMIAYETYTGMPSRYPHWSFGKAYEKTKMLHKLNLTGLPYEMVINSDPCIAYLMKDNTLLLQVLTIAHVYGHNDFFKNNRLFKEGTNAKYTVEMFKNHANRIREYVQDPGIGYEKVERILNTAHALKLQTGRVVGEKRLTNEEKRKKLYDSLQPPKNDHPLLIPEDERYRPPNIDVKKLPIEPEDNLLAFIIEYGKLEDWERDILQIVMEEAQYFIPQIETKIMNEGWASLWHYTILNKLDLPQGMHVEFIKRHNQVIRPTKGNINPYYVGFMIFQDIIKKNDGKLDKIFEIREVERDESFIRRYLTRELCNSLNLFEYKKTSNRYLITEVSNDEGWKTVRDTLAASVGMGGIPSLKIVEYIQKDSILLIKHEFDGRELELNYAYATIKHISDIWHGEIIIMTNVNGESKQIHCDENKKISLV
jgi:stage V sporulation protein R